jgi:hypothetical protein
MKQLRSLRESQAVEKRYVRRTVRLSPRGPEFSAGDAASAFLYGVRMVRTNRDVAPVALATNYPAAARAAAAVQLEKAGAPRCGSKQSLGAAAAVAATSSPARLRVRGAALRELLGRLVPALYGRGRRGRLAHRHGRKLALGVSALPAGVDLLRIGAAREAASKG